ncbi:tRNA 2p-phosphotransferase 1 [Biomphalaria glabrata]|nr:tRNA 2'-phosphotransferase 1-like [Biomphalaria glabrata]
MAKAPKPKNDRSNTTDSVVKVSKALSYLLRHGAEKRGLKLLPGGFLFLDDILQLQDFHSVTVDEIKHVVETNDKKRFTLETDLESGKLRIKANQGHSIKVEDLELQPITDATEYPIVVHGTYVRPYKQIEKEGLKPMGRMHIHFAPGEPGHHEVISGMRNSCTVLIYLNLQKAMQDGIEFFLSPNKVILSPGNIDKVIPPAYFDKVINRKTGDKLLQDGVPLNIEKEELEFQSSIVTAEDIANEFDKKKNRRKKK